MYHERYSKCIKTTQSVSLPIQANSLYINILHYVLYHF